MPGFFDGIRVGFKGTLANQKMVEVIGNNIANAANEDYSRQRADMTTSGSSLSGHLSFGQGVEIQQIRRIRDELLDGQVQLSSSAQSNFQTQLQWLQRIEGIYNEPSDHGINNALAQFWESWSELSTDPENFATRSNVMAQSKNLSSLFRKLDDKFEEFKQDIKSEMQQIVGDINSFAKEIAVLNQEIFRLENTSRSQANDLRDQRNAAMEDLAEKISFSAKEQKNGMFNIFVGHHALVHNQRAEQLMTRVDPLDASKTQILWQNGDNEFSPSGGQVSGILAVRDDLIGSFENDLNSFSKNFIDQVNKIYANGVSLNHKKTMESRLGYESLGVTNTTTALNLVDATQHGSIHISFHDQNGDFIRSSSVLVDAEDSLDNIAQKLNGVRGLNALILSDPTHDGKLYLEFDEVSGDNNLNEFSFAISNPEGGYDTSGFLDLVSFDQTAKSSNTSATIPALNSIDLSQLQTKLGESSVEDVMSKELNLSGHFSINAFETGTETSGKTDGLHVQQLRIDVESKDTINSIMEKINNLSLDHGFSISLNASNQLELTHAGKTDSEGNLLLSGGSNYLRLSFANTYQYPDVAIDQKPELYNGKGDNTGLFAAMQCNTWFQGADSSDIALDSFIDSAEKVNAGYSFAEGDNRMALDLAALQYKSVALDNTFTLNEHYQNLVADVGTQVRSLENQAQNEQVVLQSFLNTRDQISGVNLDEELANMIIYQRAYEANARMIKTFSDMLMEFLQQQ